MSDEIAVTRMDHSDFGSEWRVEVRVPGRDVIELQVSDGVGGFEVDCWQLSEGKNPYAQGHQLFHKKLAER